MCGKYRVMEIIYNEIHFRFLPQTKQIFVSETRRSGPPHSAQRLTFVLKPVNQTNRQFQLEQNLANATTIGDLKLNLTSYEEVLHLFKALSKVFPDFATLKLWVHALWYQSEFWCTKIENIVYLMVVSAILIDKFYWVNIYGWYFG